ncbi:AsmA-like C-terminal region-containing protein [Undibacterium arcticum]|uniref:AsmA-like C-terminal region-containing protein n=1 Tax=Undibacterium arcticum TaxID=1762892 RepID=UPI003622CD61
MAPRHRKLSRVSEKLFGDNQVKLNCLVGDFAIVNGIMQTRTFVLDTEDAIINIGGHIDLTKELLALNIIPKSKGLRIISFRSPLYVAGSFKS